MRSKSEVMAIGGAWSPSLDGADPANDPAVLVRTATRTVKALTGLDLSACSQWLAPRPRTPPPPEVGDTTRGRRRTRTLGDW